MGTTVLWGTLRLCILQLFRAPQTPKGFRASSDRSLAKATRYDKLAQNSSLSLLNIATVVAVRRSITGGSHEQTFACWKHLASDIGAATSAVR